MPGTYVAANWKMNTTPAEASALAAGVRAGFDRNAGVEAILCPPFICLPAVRDAVGDSGVKVGAQNMHHETSGAFTGEISPEMLHGICEYVILGHSERRQLFGEIDESVNRKVLAALAAGLAPILCVGETLEQRESGAANAVVAGQARAGLEGVVDITSVLVAYEPVWAIGTGRAATPEIAADVMGDAIQRTLETIYGAAGKQVPLLYGGSVNADNVAGFMAQPCIRGALVGGASLQAESFLDVISAIAGAVA